MDVLPGAVCQTRIAPCKQTARVSPGPAAVVRHGHDCGVGGVGPCVFRYNVHWSDVQSCFGSDTTLAVFLVADPYGINHLIDDINVDVKTFSSAADNNNGTNDPAGPTATTDPSLLPPLLFPPL